MENTPKEYPNSNDMMGREICGLDLYGCRRVNNSRNFHPSIRLGDTCKAQLAEPSQERLSSNSHLGDKYIYIYIIRNYDSWQNPPQNLF